uniref:WH2 domain-containing protein n=1 Tax=Caenorhabditis tropicalis TaxID=1561998 RepID=A0A1I7UIV8_9PELO
MTVKLKNWTLLALFFLFVAITSVDNFKVSNLNWLTSDDVSSSDEDSNNQVDTRFRRTARGRAPGRQDHGNTDKHRDQTGADSELTSNDWEAVQLLSGDVLNKASFGGKGQQPNSGPKIAKTTSPTPPDPNAFINETDTTMEIKTSTVLLPIKTSNSKTTKSPNPPTPAPNSTSKPVQAQPAPTSTSKPPLVVLASNSTSKPTPGQPAPITPTPPPPPPTTPAPPPTTPTAPSTAPAPPSTAPTPPSTAPTIPPTPSPTPPSTPPPASATNQPHPVPGSGGSSTPVQPPSTIPPNSPSTHIPVAVTTTGDQIPINSMGTALPWKRTTYTCDSLPDGSRQCIIDMCKRMKAIGEQGGDNSVIAWILLIVGIIGIAVNLIVFFLRCRKRNKNKNENVVSSSTEDAEAGNALAMKAALVKATEQAKKQEKEKTVEEPSIVSIKTKENAKKNRAKLLLAQTNMDKLRKHVKKTNAQYKSDIRSSKFEKKGPIFIPKEPPIVPAVPLPDGIVLENVTYDPKLNEMWDIGSDVDDIELDDSYQINPDSITESEASQKSGSKKGKKGGEKKKDATKSGTDDAKTTPDAAEGKDKKDDSVKKDDKSGKKDKSKKDKTKST